ncbi:MAG: sulfotransferase [Myxococcota bacterium]
MSAPAFVVGTGRCGSTLLSNMLRAHGQILSVSELFTLATDLGGRVAETFPSEPVDGAAFWRIVAGVHPKSAAMLRHGVAMDEVLYRPTAATRFTAEDGVPALLQTTLPHLSPEPDVLFAEVERFVVDRPTAPVGDHYRALFGWLARRFDKRLWIERSGGSLRIVTRLAAAFPDARFVHLVRDGRDCALSMSRHLGFRMALVAAQLTEILGVDPYESADRSLDGDLPDELVPFLPERFDPDAFRRYETPPALCGHYWSGECMAGVRALAAVDPARVLVLRYEDLARDPEGPLNRLTAFLGADFADGAWAREMSGLVRPPASTWAALPSRELRWLDAACRPGFDALGGLYP